MRSSHVLLFPFLLLAACDGAPSDFGEPRAFSPDQRPTVWGRHAAERLRVLDVGGARDPEPDSWSGTTPSGWEEQAADPQRFRDRQWRVTGNADTDCYLTVAVRGGVQGNMDRWYSQFGLEGQPADGLPTVAFAGGEGRLLVLTGSYRGAPGMTMLVVFRSNGATVMSLKFVAPEAVAKEQREAFLALAASLQPGGAPGAGNAAGGNPAGGDPHGPVADPFTATVPPDWKPKPSNKSQHHTFGTDGEVYVSELSGPLQQMTDVWRESMGHKPLTNVEFAALPNCEMLGPDALWIDVSGDLRKMTGATLENARTIVAVRSDNGVITFAKLVGPAAEVEAQVEAFRAFCASLRRDDR